jgi:hypothetical protein
MAMAAFTAAISETRSLELSDQFLDLSGHINSTKIVLRSQWGWIGFSPIDMTLESGEILS